MYRLIIGGLKYTYLASHHVVAIITDKGHKYRFRIETVQSNPKYRIQNGTADARIAPEEVAAFILKHHLR